MRHGQLVDGWFPMAKRITNLYRYAQIACGANHRYLNSLACITSPARAQDTLQRIAEPVVHQGRTIRGFNPVAKIDVAIFQAVLRGEHCIQGLRNVDLREALNMPCGKSPASRKASAWASRVLHRLHAHGLLAKVPRSRRWRPTEAGQAFMALAIRLHDTNFLTELEKVA